jgi:hypothetical protein
VIRRVGLEAAERGKLALRSTLEQGLNGKHLLLNAIESKEM